MLYNFLHKNQKEILALTEDKFIKSAGVHVSSKLLKKGLPTFFKQLLDLLKYKHSSQSLPRDKNSMIESSNLSNENKVTKSASIHGGELFRLGYTLSHVVHAYGYMCQSITEIATTKNIMIEAEEFHDLNRCLDVAIAGAVTKYQFLREKSEIKREMEHLGVLAHELRNNLTSINLALHFIKTGMVGFGGSTGQVLTESLKQMNELIERSMTEVRLHVDPKVYIESINLLKIVDLIMVTAGIQAESKNQILEIQVNPNIVLKVDRQFFHSALFNLIQNALKYSPNNSKIQVRGNLIGEQILIEVENECSSNFSRNMEELFNTFVRGDKSKEGLGLGLAITKQAIKINNGTLEVSSIENRCIFRITLPN